MSSPLSPVQKSLIRRESTGSLKTRRNSMRSILISPQAGSPRPIQNRRSSTGSTLPNSEQVEDASSVSMPLSQEVKKKKKARDKLWNKKPSGRNSLTNIKKVTLKGKVKPKMEEPSNIVQGEEDGEMDDAVNLREDEDSFPKKETLLLHIKDIHPDGGKVDSSDSQKIPGPIKSISSKQGKRKRASTVSKVSNIPDNASTVASSSEKEEQIEEEKEKEPAIPKKKARKSGKNRVNFDYPICGKHYVHEKSVERHIRKKVHKEEQAIKVDIEEDHHENDEDLEDEDARVNDVDMNSDVDDNEDEEIATSNEYGQSLNDSRLFDLDTGKVASIGGENESDGSFGVPPPPYRGSVDKTDDIPDGKDNACNRKGTEGSVCLALKDLQVKIFKMLDSSSPNPELKDITNEFDQFKKKVLSLRSTDEFSEQYMFWVTQQNILLFKVQTFENKTRERELECRRLVILNHINEMPDDIEFLMKAFGQLKLCIEKINDVTKRNEWLRIDLSLWKMYRHVCLTSAQEEIDARHCIPGSDRNWSRKDWVDSLHYRFTSALEQLQSVPSTELGDGTKEFQELDQLMELLHNTANCIRLNKLEEVIKQEQQIEWLKIALRKLPDNIVRPFHDDCLNIYKDMSSPLKCLYNYCYYWKCARKIHYKIVPWYMKRWYR